MRAPITFACLLIALVAGGCGREDPSTPVACLEGSGAYVKALAAAPGEAKLDGSTPISECLAENQQAGDLATVGEALVEAATELDSEAREDPGGDASLQLGYLIGAAQRGADKTEGIHADLIRRLTVAARYAPGRQPLSPSFVASYRRGYDAGHSAG